MSRIHFVPVLLLIGAFPIVLAFTLLEHGVVAAVGAAALILLASGLYQHHLVPLVVRSEPADDQ